MKFDDFLTEVLPSVAGCPDELALDHVVKAARTFCARTLVWNYQAPTILAEAGKAEYTLQLGDGQELVKVLLVEVGCAEYALPSGARGRQMVRDGRSGVCVMHGAHDFTLSPAPTIADEKIVTDIAVKPTRAGTYWPDDFEEYVPDIAAGAIASLCMLPGYEWTNLVHAGDREAFFNRRISVVARKISNGFGTARRGAKVVWF